MVLIGFLLLFYVLLFFSLCNEIIEFGTDKKQVHTGISPQHKKDNCGQASVGRGIIAQMINIKGKQVGKNKPTGGGYDSTGQFGNNGGFMVRDNAVEHCKKQNQNGKTDEGTATDYEQRGILEKWDFLAD